MTKTREEYMWGEKALIGASTVEHDGPVIVHGKGMFFRDLEDKMFLDFTGQVGLLNTGYCPSEVVAAIQQMAGKLSACMAADWSYCVEVKINGKVKEISRVALAERLIELTDEVMPFKKRIYFEVSGATAINLAVKIAKICRQKERGIRTEYFKPIFEKNIFIPRQENLYRFSLLAFRGAFHGRHGEAHALSDSKLMHSWAISSSSTVIRLDFPMISAAKGGQTVDSIDAILEQYSSSFAPPIAAFVFEPVQGEGGINVPDGKTLKEIVEYTRSKKFCIIADEVQTGFGRTGKMFACEHFGIQPDVVVLSKSLGAGLPLGAVIVNAEKFPDLEQGMHSGSMHSSPLAVAAAIANIDFILENGLVEQSANHGAYLMSRLKELASHCKEIVDVRGLGLMVGIEFESIEQRGKIIKECIEQGLLVAAAGEKTIRMTPALVVTIPQIDIAINKFSLALEKTFK